MTKVLVVGGAGYIGGAVEDSWGFGSGCELRSPSTRRCAPQFGGYFCRATGVRFRPQVTFEEGLAEYLDWVDRKFSSQSQKPVCECDEHIR